jgi:hypothetical protein
MGSISNAYQSGQRSLLFEWWKNVFFYYINDIIGKKGSDTLRWGTVGQCFVSCQQPPLSCCSSDLNPTSSSSTAPPPRLSPYSLLSLACSSSSRVIRFTVPLQGSILLVSTDEELMWVSGTGSSWLGCCSLEKGKIEYKLVWDLNHRLCN